MLLQQQNRQSGSLPTDDAESFKRGLTPYDERHVIVKVARGEGADSAGVFPLVWDLCAHDDQRRVHGGFIAFKAHTLRPRPKRCRQRDKHKEKERQKVRVWEGGRD